MSSGVAERSCAPVNECLWNTLSKERGRGCVSVERHSVKRTIVKRTIVKRSVSEMKVCQRMRAALLLTASYPTPLPCPLHSRTHRRLCTQYARALCNRLCLFFVFFFMSKNPKIKIQNWREVRTPWGRCCRARPTQTCRATGRAAPAPPSPWGRRCAASRLHDVVPLLAANKLQYKSDFTAKRKQVSPQQADPQQAFVYQNAPSSMSPLQTSMAGVSRVSPVSFLNAKPKSAMSLLRIVLNMLVIMRFTKRSFW